jgi:hypothetical protein
MAAIQSFDRSDAVKVGPDESIVLESGDSRTSIVEIDYKEGGETDAPGQIQMICPVHKLFRHKWFKFEIRQCDFCPFCQ